MHGFSCSLHACNKTQLKSFIQSYLLYFKFFQLQPALASKAKVYAKITSATPEKKPKTVKWNATFQKYNMVL